MEDEDTVERKRLEAMSVSHQAILVKVSEEFKALDQV
jgi:hypothetical protein